jgi:hypothetical protein
MLKLLRNGRKNTVVQMNGNEIKEVDKFVYLGSTIENNGRSKM